MSIDPERVRPRRAVIAAAAGAAATALAGSLARPGVAQAASGSFDSAAENAPAVSATHNASGIAVAAIGNGNGAYGVYAYAQNGVGVLAASDTAEAITASTSTAGAAVLLAIHHATGTAIHGRTGPYSPLLPANTGVFGTSETGTGVRGNSSSGGIGVHGDSPSGYGVAGNASTGTGAIGTSVSGTGVRATSTSGYALHATGRIRAEKVSGIATIAAGATAVTVALKVDVTPSSFVLLSPMANVGTRALWWTINATNNTIAIHLSPARGSATKVSWLLLG